MFKSIQDMITYVNKEEVKVIDFKVTDLTGTWHRLSITSQKLKPDIMQKGIGFDGSSYGFNSVEKSDMVMIPDVSSCYLDTLKHVKTLVCIADIYAINNHTMVRYQDDPRYIAEKAEKFILNSGVADQILLGPEFEFYVLDHISYEYTNQHMEVTIDSKQAEWNTKKKDEPNLGLQVKHHGAYHLDSPFDQSYEFRTDVVIEAERIGIPIKYHHGENGGPGQVEIEVEFASIKEMGDRSMKIKNILKQMASERQKVVTFMPKPFATESGSGMHVHMQLKKNGAYIMYDESGYSHLSKTALYMIGGILHHARSLTAITNPTTNSYKRLVPGFEAPVTVGFANANRSAVIRIPGYTLDETEKRFEYRSPDAMSNPYLTYAALMLAAYDGIIHKIDPMDQGYGPYDFNLYDLSDEDKKKIKSLPASLEEACQALKEDHDYLHAGDVFTQSIIDTHIKKVMKDHQLMQKMPHPLEFDLYFKR
ncbi:MAG: type I glutamate--ammonia ligase [Acholeplasma sp.]|nr:MAG: type I glutamate--ammonia ligase [Acholeplasma sp.]